MSNTATAMSEKPTLFFNEESQSDRLARKTKEAPFFPIAIGACAIACALGAYGFRKKGKMSTSVYLMQLRVAAQGLAVGTITLGLGYTMYNEYFAKKNDKQ
ncbi:hypothetical protein FQR65_LT15004 [Abscondita terminalis]|nr:hypothetical protein FQR65_LT15004 [Abscondita terminalis]